MGQKSETRKEAPAAISQIDGQSPRNPRKSDPIPPGKHTIQVSFSSARAVIADNLKPLELDLAPCTRYYLVAKYRSPTGPEWEPAISYSEPIGECRKKFMKGSK
jgi:hypothetical protein